MSLTKEMIMGVEREVELFDNQHLLLYYNTYKRMSQEHPNFYYSFKVEKALTEIMNRGIEDNIMEHPNV
jgi:hypothetical protein